MARVKGLVIFGTLVRLVVPTLEELTGERVVEVLPVLQLLFLEAPQPSAEHSQEADSQCIDSETRQLSGYPVSVHHWPGELE